MTAPQAESEIANALHILEIGECLNDFLGDRSHNPLGPRVARRFARELLDVGARTDQKGHRFRHEAVPRLLVTRFSFLVSVRQRQSIIGTQSGPN
jgi:hypothetical protein